MKWNLFSDLLEQDTHERGEQIHEIASTVFGEELDQAGDNIFFAMAARDIFAAVVEAMSRQGQVFSNADIRSQLELPADELQELLESRQPAPGRRGPVPRGRPSVRGSSWPFSSSRCGSRSRASSAFAALSRCGNFIRRKAARRCSSSTT